MKVSFPAMRAEMGKRAYYACVMKLSSIPKMFTFTDWAEFMPEDREQRVLNKNRVPEIIRYIVDNEDGYLFASITASYKCEVVFKPVEGSDTLGQLEMEFENANFVINDGQHRCAAIAGALKENPALGDEAISVLLFPYENRDRVQQMFSDLNRYVAKTSKSLDILYDKRDMLSKVTIEVAHRVSVFEGMVEKEAISMPVRSPKLFTLSALYDANVELLQHHKNGEDSSINGLIEQGTEFWTEVAALIPPWSRVKRQELRAVEYRQENISSHAVVLRAIGGVGAELIKTYPDTWKEKLRLLGEVDWKKQNRDWDNICIVANSVVSNRQARNATKAYLKYKLGLELSESDQKAIAHVLAAAQPGATL
jgi:DNA sulfur modification protein DndB